jgi:hypothetical protein
MCSRDSFCICLGVAVSHERCYPRGPKDEAARLRIDEPPFAYLSLPRLLDRNQGFWSICLQALLAYTMHTPRMLVAAAVCRNDNCYSPEVDISSTSGPLSTVPSLFPHFLIHTCHL